MLAIWVKQIYSISSFRLCFTLDRLHKSTLFYCMSYNLYLSKFFVISIYFWEEIKRPFKRAFMATFPLKMDNNKEHVKISPSTFSSLRQIIIFLIFPKLKADMNDFKVNKISLCFYELNAGGHNPFISQILLESEQSEF